MQKTQNLNSATLRNILTLLPKSEIHLHLEGLARVDTIWELHQKYDIQSPDIVTKEDLTRKFQVKSLDEFISLFINVLQNSFKKVEDLEYQVKDARSYFINNNIGYAEVHFAPTKFLLNGLDFNEIMSVLDKGAADLKKNDNITMKYIIDVSRSYGPENALNNLNLAIKSKSSNIIGIGLGGTEIKGPARDYQYVFEKAIAEGLNVVAHAGEDVGPESIWDALNLLKAQRIGHGISAIKDKQLLIKLAEEKIPLEVCPTSNLFTQKFVQVIEDHPIKPFYENGLVVTLNTDDPTIFGVELIEEYMKLFESGLFTAEQLIDIMRNNIASSFMPDTEKTAYLQAFDEKVLALIGA